MAMCTTPLAYYFEFGGTRPAFAQQSSALWRGYVGTWEVRDARLYLIGLSGSLEDGTPATLRTLFPDFPDRVFAHWFSGIARIPQGKLLEYVHMGYGSKYERDLLLSFEKGVLQETQIRVNGVGADGAPENYDVAAFTTFPRQAR